MFFAVLFILISLICTPVFAQEEMAKNEQKGFKLTGVPYINYTSDEGFGSGARLLLFNHAEGGFNPYYYVIDANLFLTTEGKKEFFIFSDFPHFLKTKNRITGELKFQHFNFSPYYGIGNDTEYHKELTEKGTIDFINTHYYHFERTRFTCWINYQRLIGTFKILGGAGISHTDIGVHTGRTLLQDDMVAGKNGGYTNYLKFGIIRDTRDFEPAPGGGDWTEVILELSHSILGSDYDYNRITVTNRHYITVFKNVVFAERIVFEKGWGEMPFYETAFFESSYRIQEGLGGAKSVRGLLLNRFIGPGKIFGNLEIRWRFLDFGVLKQNFYLAWSGFYDFGKVWKENQIFNLKSINTGYGSGLHIGWNEDFIVSFDAARSNEVDLALYIGIGYLY